MNGFLCAAPCGTLMRPAVYLCAAGACGPAPARGACACGAPRVAAPGAMLCPRCGARQPMHGAFWRQAAPGAAPARPPAAAMLADPTRARRWAACPACGAAGACAVFAYSDDAALHLACGACDHAWNPERADRAFSTRDAGAAAAAAFAAPLANGGIGLPQRGGR